MRVVENRTATTFSRFACAAAVLFIFFFPLHFHFSPGSQLTSQCSCLQGARTHFVVADDTPTVLPIPQFAVLLEPQVCEWRSTASTCRHVRGPPRSVSL